MSLAFRKNEHEAVNKQLSVYIDHELAPREQKRVQAHLVTCRECQQELETLIWTRALLHQMPQEKAPRSFVVREADVAPRVRRRPWFMLSPQWATAAVALMFIVVLIGDLLTGGWMFAMGNLAPQEAMMVQSTPPIMYKEAVPEKDEGGKSGGGEKGPKSLENQTPQPESAQVRGVEPDEGQADVTVSPLEVELEMAPVLTTTAVAILAAPPTETMAISETWSITPPIPEPGEMPQEDYGAVPSARSGLRLVLRIVEVILGLTLLVLLVFILRLRSRP